jgi:hypothetical protein
VSTTLTNTGDRGAEAFFLARSAHSDIAEELVASLKGLGEYEVKRAPREFGAVFGVTRATIFCGAAGMDATYWRLRPRDLSVALRSGAEQASIGSEWAKILSFRSDWPRPDLPFWALRAYDYARSGE